MSNIKYFTEEEKKLAIKKRKKLSYEKNKEKISKKNKAFYRENRIVIKKRAADYRERNKKITKNKRKKYFTEEERLQAIRKSAMLSYYNNHEKRIEKGKEYYKNNKDKRKKTMKQWESENRESRKEYLKKWRKVNYYKNKNKLLARCKAYHKKNPLSSKLSKIRRRESLKSLGEKSLVNKNFIHTVTLKFNNRCFRCNSDKDLCIDHHYPLYLGNPLTISNAVLLCRSCNSSKSIKLPESFYSPEQLTDLQLNYGISKSPVKEEQPSLFEARMPKNLERDNGIFEAMNAA